MAYVQASDNWPALLHFVAISPERRGFRVYGHWCILLQYAGNLRILRVDTRHDRDRGGRDDEAWRPTPYHTNASTAVKCARVGARKQEIAERKEAGCPKGMAQHDAALALPSMDGAKTTT